ncbi:MAG: hypothetical protein NTW87_29075 [Planctomycetota bacterium]|nr:hypothetical protein [Planctomycetota bacterium]
MSQEAKFFVAAEPKRESRAGLWIVAGAIGAVLLLCVIGVVALIALQPAAKTTEVAPPAPVATVATPRRAPVEAAVKPPRPPPEIVADWAAKENKAKAAAAAKEQRAQLKAEQEKDAKAAALTKAADDWREEAFKGGVLKKVKGAEFWVNPFLWAQADRDVKEGIIRNCSRHNELYGGTGMVTILSFADDAILGEFTWRGPQIKR